MTGDQIAIAAVLTLAVVVSAARPQPRNAFPEASAQIQDLVRDAIADRFRAGDIPDINLLPDRSRVLVRRELPSDSVQLTERALPKLTGSRFELISFADAQVMTAATAHDVVYIVVDAPRIEDDTATISLGVDFVAADKAALKMCCCSGRARFRRKADHWSFADWSSISCS